MSRKNKDSFSEFIVGIFMAAVLALLVYFTIVISGVDLLAGREKTTATITFADVGGLKERDNVIYRGMKVGTVERIVLAPSNIVVSVKIDRDVVLRESAYISVATLSLLGGNYLVMEEGKGAVRPLATTRFHGTPPMDWMRDLGEIARSVKEMTSQGALKNIISNMEETAVNVNRIVARVERGEGTAGKFLSADDTVYFDVKAALADAKQALASAQKTFDKTAEISERLARGEGTLGKLLSSDETLYSDVKKTMANAAEISERLSRGEGTMGRLLSKDDAVWVDLKASVENIKSATAKLKSGDGLLARVFNDKKLADDASALVSNLNIVASRLEKGEGTLGKLTSESEMYDELSSLIKDVRQIVDNYRDTTPITTFGSLATGAL
jgi:phospholipid/cholesterol/gamma-HCH transport system substrate-binding protein